MQSLHVGFYFVSTCPKTFCYDCVMAEIGPSFWGDNHYKNPPVTDEWIARAEALFGVKLPAEYIELVKIQNGGFLDLAFPTTQVPSWAEDHVPFEEMAGIAFDRDLPSMQNILDTEYMTREWELPPNQILLAGDGHTWVSLDYRGRTEPVVSWLDVEMEEECVLANSFAEFIKALVPISNFEPDDE